MPWFRWSLLPFFFFFFFPFCFHRIDVVRSPAPLTLVCFRYLFSLFPFAWQPDGTIEAPTPVAEVRQTPYSLPAPFVWSDVDVSDDSQLSELHALLRDHYVEDSECSFRFAYGRSFLRWALEPPGFKRSWHVGVRAGPTGRLVAFISGIPQLIRCDERRYPSADVNFLCVHKKLRSKRLAPVLIREITRRVHLTDAWHAVYTAGVVLPKPAAECQYWHRSLNPKKLVEVGFSRLGGRMTMARTIKTYRLPATPRIPGSRRMTKADVPRVAQLLRGYLSKFRLSPVFTDEEVEHWLLPGDDDVVRAYVVEQTEVLQPKGDLSEGAKAIERERAEEQAKVELRAKEIKEMVRQVRGEDQTTEEEKEEPTDAKKDEAAAATSSSEASGPVVGSRIVALYSFYTLPSSVIGNDLHNEISAAYQFYTVPGPFPVEDIMFDALVAANATNHDVFNALDVLENGPHLEELKFGVGDGKLRYYLYNWRVKNQVKSSDVGLIML